MKAEIKGDFIYLYVETKKEAKKLDKFMKNNAAYAVIPRSIKRLAYWEFENVKIVIP